jgi:predicted MFS family arabinose efflux permease
MPVFAEDVVHVGPDGLGILLMAFGTGSLIGPLLIAGRPDIPHRGVVILLSAGMGGVALIALSQTSNMLIAMLVLVPAGIAMMLYHTLTNTTLQILTPDEFRGRVTSLYMMDHGLVPLGSVIAGALAQAWGAPTAILIGGVACTVVVAMASVRYEIVRRL